MTLTEIKEWCAKWSKRGNGRGSVSPQGPKQMVEWFTQADRQREACLIETEEICFVDTLQINHAEALKPVADKLHSLRKFGLSCTGKFPVVFSKVITEDTVSDDLASTLFVLLGAALKQLKEPLVIDVDTNKSCDFSLASSFVVTEKDAKGNSKGFVVVNLRDV